MTRRTAWLARLLVALSCAAILAGLLAGNAVDWLGNPQHLWGRVLRLERPELVFLIAGLPLLALSARSSLTGLAPVQRALSFCLRAALLACLLLAAAGPLEVQPTHRVCSVVLVDVSSSVGQAALVRASSTIGRLLPTSAEPDAPSSASNPSVIAFGRDAHLVPLERDDEGRLVPPSPSALRAAASGEETDVEGAFRLARAMTSADCLKRYLLLTDGIETVGRAATSIAREHARGARVSVLPLTDRPEPDVAVIGVDTDRAVLVGEPFEVRVTLRATQATSGTLTLLQNGDENGLGGRLEAQLTEGEQTVTFPSVVRVKGAVVYQATFRPDGPDQFAENNQFGTSLDVPGPPRLLIVDREPGQATYLAQALVAQQFDVDVRAPSAFPRSARELAEFSFVILSDVPRRDLSRGGEGLLLDYVRRGGGLLFAGGEASFGPGGWQSSQLASALPVRMDSEKDREIPGVAMSLVIDRSGSMTGLPLQMAKEACVATVGVLSESDVIEVIAFDSKPSRFVPLQKARYHMRIESAVRTMQPGGGTEIFSSLDMAYQDLASITARKKHIILLTDGNASSDGIYELSVAAFAEGITITTVGLGAGANAELLGMIAEAGGGRFHAVDDPSSLPQIFTRETELISKETSVTDWVPVLPASRPKFLAGVPLAGAPYLRGFTRTQMRGPPSELVLKTDTAEPILARRPWGLGWTLAWTSDLKAHWASDWLRWPAFGGLFAQLVRAHQLTDKTRVIDLRVERHGSEVQAEFDAFDDEERFDSSLVSELVIQAEGDEKPITASFERVAPGRYVARAKLPHFGSYALLATHRRKTSSGDLVPVAMSRSSVSRPYPEEYQVLEPKPEVLRSWARVGGGVFAPSDPHEATRPGSDHVTSEKGRQAALIFLSLGLFLLDLLVRRVRLIDRQFRRTA